MLENGSSNDVTILVKDGEMKANMDILAARSDYFATIDGQTKTIDMKHIDKNVMETVISFIFSGEILYRQMKLEDLLEVMNLLRLFLLNEELERAEKFLVFNVNAKKFSVLDVVNGLPLAKNIKISEELILRFVRRIEDSFAKHFYCPQCEPQESLRVAMETILKYPYYICLQRYSSI